MSSIAQTTARADLPDPPGLTPPDSLLEGHQDYLRIQKAIEFLATHRLRQPSLMELAEHLHLSEFHLQRLFTQWAGVSPKRFVQFLTKEHAKQLLHTHSVQDTALAVGLSGSSRLHDLMVTCESVTPGQYQRMGKSLHIAWGVHPSPFGQCLLAVTERGICFLAFFDTETEWEAVKQDFQSNWSCAQLIHDEARTRAWALRIFPPHGSHSQLPHPSQPLSLLLKGSPFQLKVWEALLRIPMGHASTYSDVAQAIDNPTATRAVASAIARNQIGFLIPCHRVIRNTGEIHAYRWGSTRKRALLAWESGQTV